MKLLYIGHACFLLTTSGGLRILIDPYQPGAFGGAIGYGPIPFGADVVLVTHEHADHNAVNAAPGTPKQVIRGTGSWEVDGVRIHGVLTYHDEKQGRERGPNTVFVIEADGLKIAHLGDLGHVLTQEQVKEIGPVDVLLIPVGSVFTIGPAEAWKVVEELQPKVIIPMHYKTPKVGFPLEPVEHFTQGKEHVKQLSSEVSIEELPQQQEVWVLRPYMLDR